MNKSLEQIPKFVSKAVERVFGEAPARAPRRHAIRMLYQTSEVVA